MTIGNSTTTRKKHAATRLAGSVLLSAVAMSAFLGTASATVESLFKPSGTIGIGIVKSRSEVEAPSVHDKLVVDENSTAPAALLVPATRVPVSVPQATPAAPAPASAPAPAPAPAVAPAATDGWAVARCSWYGPGFYGNSTASGQVLQPDSMFVAHKSLPFGTRIEFRYNGATAIGVVEDRGPYSGGRTFDLGPGLAAALGFSGVGDVSYRILP